MRGVVVFTIALFSAVALLVVGAPLIEGVGEEVRSYDTVDGQDAQTIDDMYTAVFRWIPMIITVGFGVWGVAWYIRKQRLIQRR